MQTSQTTIDLSALASAIENTKRAGQFWAQPVDQTHLDNLLGRMRAAQSEAWEDDLIVRAARS